MGMPSGEDKKTIAIRVSPELRGRLESVLQITGGSVNAAGTEALENWIAGKLADPEVRAKALEGLEAEERALQVRRQALQGLVGERGETPAKPPEPKPPSSRRGGSKS
jgi:predicted DNA-binding protein